MATGSELGTGDMVVSKTHLTPRRLLSPLTHEPLFILIPTPEFPLGPTSSS